MTVVTVIVHCYLKIQIDLYTFLQIIQVMHYKMCVILVIGIPETVHKTLERSRIRKMNVVILPLLGFCLN